MYECPECERITMDRLENGDFFCSSCEATFLAQEMEKCSICGDYYRKADQVEIPEMCPSCFREKMEE